jgi:hypothetical protein
LLRFADYETEIQADPCSESGMLMGISTNISHLTILAAGKTDFWLHMLCKTGILHIPDVNEKSGPCKNISSYSEL